MKKLTDQDIYPLLYNYIGAQKGFKKTSKKFKKEAKIENQDSPIATLNLFQIIKDHVISSSDKQFRKSYKKYLKGKDKVDQGKQNGDEGQKQDQVVNRTAEDYQTAINSYQKEEYEQDNKAQSEQYQGEEQYQEKEEEYQDQEQYQNQEPPNKRSKTIARKKNFKNSFTRINHKIQDISKQSLKDNSFYAKKKFGHGDQFGQVGQHMLGGRHGKQFKKQKTKLKNKNFQGAGQKLNLQPNSILL